MRYATARRLIEDRPETWATFAPRNFLAQEDVPSSPCGACGCGPCACEDPDGPGEVEVAEDGVGLMDREVA